MGISSILLPDNILILFSFSYQYSDEIHDCSKFHVVCHIIVHLSPKLKQLSGIGLYTLALQQVQFIFWRIGWFWYNIASIGIYFHDLNVCYGLEQK